MKTATIKTNHFQGREMPLTSVLFALAAQEGNDGDEGNAMQAAGERILELEACLRASNAAPPQKANLCDCELSHNGMGMVGRECDCPAGAPPHVAECYACGGKPIEHCSVCDAEGTPHVEPSAAEGAEDSEWVKVHCSDCGANLEFRRTLKATEARMLELARKMTIANGNEQNVDPLIVHAHELATLVEKTLGSGK